MKKKKTLITFLILLLGRKVLNCAHREYYVLYGSVIYIGTVRLIIIIVMKNTIAIINYYNVLTTDVR